MTWTATPFLLDYQRNKIIDVHPAGLSQRWAHVVPVKYILWQHDEYERQLAGFRYELGFGRRTGRIAARSLDTLDWMREVVSNSQVICDVDGMVLVRTANDERQAPD